MKYDNLPMTPTIKALTTLIICLLLGACAGTAGKPQKTRPDAKPQQSVTKNYLPVRQYDKEGQVVPFIAMINPYEEIKGRIDKQVVMDYIAARKAYKSKHFDETEALLKRIIANDKNLAGPWVMLGQIALEKGEVSTAMTDFEKAITVNKLNVNAYLPLAKLYRQQGDFIKAQNTYAAALAVWKDFPEAHLNLAILYDIYLNDSLQAQQHMEAYQFLTENKDPTVAQWLEEIRSRTGIEANLYIGPSSTSQISKGTGDKG